MFGLFGKPSKDRFAKMVLAEARRAGVKTAFEFDAAEFVLKYGDGRLYLGNAYDDYCQAKDGGHKRRLISNIVATLSIPKDEHEATFEEVRDRLFPGTRERALFSFTELERQISGNSDVLPVISEPISDWFARVLIIDHPQTVSYVSEKQFANWGLSRDEAFETGLGNLKACTTPAFKQDDTGYFTGQWNDDYDSSRLLVDGLFDDLPIDGDPVVVIPNRLTLMVAGSGHTGAIKAMLARAEEIVRTVSRAQNCAPLVIRDGNVCDFHVPVDSPVFNEVSRARGLAALFYYDQQQTLLASLHTKTGKDIHVAKYSFNKLPDGSYRSYSVWSKGVATLLPKTDTVTLYDPEKPEKERVIGSFGWDELSATAGDLMLDTEMFPARYYVSGFPNTAQLPGGGL